MAQHANLLKDSMPDDVGLARAVEEKFLELCELYFRQMGEQLKIPEAIKRSALLWREMRIRHKKRDFRHSEDELQACKDFAQWTLDVRNELRGKAQEQHSWR